MKSIVALILCFALCGCGVLHKSKNPQIVVANNLLEAATLSDTLSIGLKAAKEYADTAQASKLIAPAEADHIRTWVSNIAKKNDQAIAAIQLAESGNAQVDWRAAIAAVAVEAGKEDPKTFFIKNPDSQKDFQIAIATMQGAIIAISNTFGGR